MQKKILIAIDGPAASGKSTTAKLLAKKLNYSYLDTGAMYRAITLKFLEQKIDLENLKKWKKILETTEVFLDYSNGNLEVWLDKVNVTSKIRTPEINNSISEVASMAFVREKMVALQQEIGKNGGWVIDGRDIGTVVFPKAEVKIFMVASVEVRAKRRQKDYENSGLSIPFEQVVSEIKKRDEIDSNREVSPLKQAKDAIVFDTSDLSIEEQVEFLYKKILEKI
ncbi:(d)CMP kinase [bacterium]|nr:(d)CMP kinase [bacterium]